MKKIFLLAMLVPFVTICSCQKQESAAEQQLAQRKVELDAREEALAEKKNALDEREKTLAEIEKATADARTIRPDVQSHVADPAQAKAERDRRIQQLPPEFRALIPDGSRQEADKAEKDRITQERAIQTKRSLQDTRTKKLSAIASPDAESPEAGATSPSPSPTPQ